MRGTSWRSPNEDHRRGMAGTERATACPMSLERLRMTESRIVLALAALVTPAAAASCSQSPPSSSSSTAGSSCKTAGGTCVLGNATCVQQASSSAQDCSPPPMNLGGAFCCLELQEGGSAQDTSVGESGGTAADGPSGDGALPACTWPASLDDAAPPQCSAARAYVACQDGDLCMSNDPTTCPGVPGASCTDMCNANEYAVGCVGPLAPPLPAECRGVFSGNGGGAVGCCPCGSIGTLNDGGTVAEEGG
jgi:hypothetical protein